MPRRMTSVTLPEARAINCQLSTTAFTKASVLGQALCSDSEVTRSGCLAASHRPMAAPSERPNTWARGMSMAAMKAATSSAISSME